MTSLVSNGVVEASVGATSFSAHAAHGDLFEGWLTFGGVPLMTLHPFSFRVLEVSLCIFPFAMIALFTHLWTLLFSGKDDQVANPRSPLVTSHYPDTYALCTLRLFEGATHVNGLCEVCAHLRLYSPV